MAQKKREPVVATELSGVTVKLHPPSWAKGVPDIVIPIEVLPAVKEFRKVYPQKGSTNAFAAQMLLAYLWEAFFPDRTFDGKKKKKNPLPLKVDNVPTLPLRHLIRIAYGRIEQIQNDIDAVDAADNGEE